MDELQSHLRREPPPGDDVVVARGGEDNTEKLRRHAERIHRAYVLDGRPLYGLSVYCALDELAGRRLTRQLASYHLVRLSTVGRLRTAGFPLLPTFARPHFTIVLPSVESADLDRLLACFDPASHNPGYGRFQR
jgi:hypothetical protein